MKKRKYFCLVLCILILALTACSKNEDKKLKLGTGGTGGNYYNYGLNLSEMLIGSDNPVKLEVVATEGSAANLRLISQDYLDMALVQSDALNDALNGEGTFKGGKLSGFHAVKGLYTEAIQIVTLKTSDLNSVSDLESHTISIGAVDSGTAKNAMDILDACGLDENDVNIINLPFEESAEALKVGEIDAFFVTASYPTTAISELSDTTDIKIIPLDSATINRLIKKNSSYVKCDVKENTYNGQTTAISSIGVMAVLIANDKLDPNIENSIVTILESQNNELMEVSFGARAEEPASGIPKIPIDMYQTLALAVFVLYLGTFLRKKIRFLETFCIPAPVIGGLIFAILSCLLYTTGIVEFEFDETLKTVCMVIFFTSVGFQANIKILRKGGISLVIFLVCIVVLIFCQNGLAIGLSKLINVDTNVGLCTGSIPMIGGHGTAGAFGEVLEDLGLNGALTLCTAAATFGLVMGSLMGGPIGRRLIIKHDLTKTIVEEDDTVLVEEEVKHHRSVSMYAPAAYQLAIAMGIGTVVSLLLSKTGMTFPIYIGAMIVAAIMRNASEYTGKFTIHMGEINDLGGICLSLFLGIAMVTLKLWQLASLALPLFILLLAQTVFMAIFTYFVIFNVMGRNYDAAILSAGTCGFGMGATPNAMANMQALTEKYAPSVQAYLLVPIVGSMFADFLNSLIITFFINVF